MKLKRKLSDDSKQIFLEVCVIPSAVSTQAIASTGIDAVIIDQEHGAVSPDQLHSMIAATAGTGLRSLSESSRKKGGICEDSTRYGCRGYCFSADP